MSGPGYVDDDGVVHPGVSIFGFRELAKRAAVMEYRMGMRPLSWIHMTDVNIVPMLSFGTMHYDWEWRDQGAYATMDMQDRLDVDKDTSMILAMSTGLQDGNIGVCLDRLRPPQGSTVTREWLIRTALAVTLPHEMKLHVPEDSVSKVDNILEDFGYGQPDCKVYRYWEPGQPLTTAGPNVKALVLSRGKRAMIIVGSFGPGGDCKLTLDLKTLDLPSTAKAVNAETGEKLASSAPGVFTLPIVKHDFWLVTVE